MKKLIIESEYKTPSVNFDGYSGILDIKGKSLPEETADFYQPIIEWLDIYIKSPAPQTTFNIFLEYCNSFSRKFVVEMINMINSLNNETNSSIINWYYEEDDEELLEEGKIYATLTGAQMNFIETKEEE